MRYKAIRFFVDCGCLHFLIMLLLTFAFIRVGKNKVVEYLKPMVANGLKSLLLFSSDVDKVLVQEYNFVLLLNWCHESF